VWVTHRVAVQWGPLIAASAQAAPPWTITMASTLREDTIAVGDFSGLVAAIERQSRMESSPQIAIGLRTGR
jgi:hypothetical protein